MSTWALVGWLGVVAFALLSGIRIGWLFGRIAGQADRVEGHGRMIAELREVQREIEEERKRLESEANRLVQLLPVRGALR